MLGEIDRDFYCTDTYRAREDACPAIDLCKKQENNCPSRKHKWPTPKQFREEYGREWEGAVYLICWQYREGGIELIYSVDVPGWQVATLRQAERRIDELKRNNAMLSMNHPPEMIHNGWAVVCASTPWGKPENDWRPE